MDAGKLNKDKKRGPIYCRNCTASPHDPTFISSALGMAGSAGGGGHTSEHPIWIKWEQTACSEAGLDILWRERYFPCRAI